MSDIMGNDQVQSLLEYCINEARTKKIDYASVVLHEQPDIIQGGRAGLAEIEPQIVIAMREAAITIEKDIDARQKPPTDPNLDSSYVCYNVASNAMSYDFATWLLVAEMMRRKDNTPAPLKVGFWRGKDNNLGIDEPSRRQFYYNVVKPLVPLVGAVEDPAACAGRDLPYNAGQIVDLYHEGVEVPYYKPTQEYLDKVYAWLRGMDNIVTITLRETDTWAFRNSSVDEWCKFADYLKTQGFTPIIVRDTSIAESRIPGQTICPEASKDINFRLALYSMARANCMISNGPASCVYVSPWPYLLFIEDLPNDHWYFPNTKDNWDNKMKCPVGTQYPWAKDNQRIFWGKDTYDNILTGWSQIKDKL